MTGKSLLTLSIDAFSAQENAGYFSSGGGRGYSTRVTIAAARAINRTLEHMRTLMIRDIRSIYNVSRAELAAAMKFTRAKAKKVMMGSLSFVGRDALPLISFRGKQLAKGVSVKVLKTSRAGMIRPGGSHEILATSRGRAAVWIAKGQILARTAKDDHPIMLWGPSFMAFFRRPGVEEELRARTWEKYDERLRHELAWAMQNQTSNYGRSGKAGKT
jgi:hypothetical protein